MHFFSFYQCHHGNKECVVLLCSPMYLWCFNVLQGPVGGTGISGFPGLRVSFSFVSPCLVNRHSPWSALICFGLVYLFLWQQCILLLTTPKIKVMVLDSVLVAQHVFSTLSPQASQCQTALRCHIYMNPNDEWRQECRWHQYINNIDNIGPNFTFHFKQSSTCCYR